VTAIDFESSTAEVASLISVSLSVAGPVTSGPVPLRFWVEYGKRTTHGPVAGHVTDVPPDGHVLFPWTHSPWSVNDPLGLATVATHCPLGLLGRTGDVLSMPKAPRNVPEPAA